MLTKYLLFHYTLLHYTHANIAWLALKRWNLKNYLGNKIKLRVSYQRFTHVCPLPETLNALNVYQMSLFQVLLLMHKIRSNSFPRISLHQFQTTSHKYATQYSRNNFKEPTRETNYAKCCIDERDTILNSFFNEKNILSFFKRKIKEKICQQQILYLYDIPPCKKALKRRLFWILKFHMCIENPLLL